MKKYILLAAVAISLTACSTEDNYIDDPVAAHISATIGESVMSRASDISWGEEDNIGISMDDRYLNLKYTTKNGDGTFEGTPMYFKNKVEPVTITAYYPHAGNEGEAPAIIETSTGGERQTSAEQPKFDFLYAVQENVTGAEPNVNLSFSHKMSKLTFVFVNGNDGTDVSKITSCEINGLILDGSFNPATGECAASPAASVSPLTLSPVMGEWQPLILFPQSVGKVTMKINDSEAQEYSCELKFDGNRLESGNNYLYTITVKKTGLTVKTYEINKWTEMPLGSEAVSE